MKFASHRNHPTKREEKMSPLDNIDSTTCHQQPSPDHAVWGHIGHATARLALRLSLAVLLSLSAVHMAMAGSKLASDLPLKTNGNTEVIVQFQRIPADSDLKAFGPSQIKRRFRHVTAVHIELTPEELLALQSKPLVT